MAGGDRRTFLFDIGNVLVRFDFAPALRALAARSGHSVTKVTALLAPLRDAHERGRMGDGDFVSQAIQAIGFRGNAAEFRRLWCDIFTDNAPMVETVRHLAGHHRLLHLSNTNGLHVAWLNEHFPVMGLFEGGSYSHLARDMKPGDGIYRHALETFGLDPARTFYVDDLLPNILTGRRFGIQSHHYSADRHAEFEAELTAWLE